MSNTLLKVRELNAFYGASHVLRDLDFTIERGQTVGLMGRNGMGKSTLLKSIIGLLKPRSGSIEFQGQAIQGQSP
jgi:branched-chain amino acid transport system ATP-binding protein